MSDLEIFARRAGAAARDEAALRLDGVPAPSAPSQSWQRRRRMLVAAAAAAAVTVAAVVSGLGTVRAPVIDSARPPATPNAPVVEQPVAENGVLPVPEAGSALPAYLEDGRPVFVSHPEQGDVVVLDAVDPRAPFGGWQQLVAWCESSGWFEELRHGSRFNGWGEWTGGPAPAGLAVYPSELADDGETVRVTGSSGEPPERDAGIREQSPRGPSCPDEIEERAAGNKATVYHQPPADTEAMDGSALPAGRWQWARLVIGGTAAAPLVCDADGICPADAPAVAGIEPSDGGRLLNRVPRTVLARRLDTGDVEILMPATDVEGPHPGSGGWPDPDRLLQVPETGAVSATHLANQAPVWVVHDGGGDVRVLAATSPANPTSLTAWCGGGEVFLDALGVRYRSDGVPVVAAVEGMKRYPAELVELGETHGVRVTGDAQPGLEGSGGTHSIPAAVCEQVVMHAPDERTYVIEPGVQISDEDRWQWARMEIQPVDGELYLCAGSDQPCGQLGDPEIGALCTQHDPDDPDTLECEPYRDPIVITPGAEPTDGPQLMLIRAHDGGRSVDIRLPPLELATPD